MNYIAHIMNRLFLLFTILFGATLFSCSDSESYNPYDEQRKGDFYPSDITIKKNTESRETTEKWSNIKRDRTGRVTSYDYTLEIKGDISQKEERSHIITYFTTHEGLDAIETTINLKYSKSANGITEEYNREIQEIVSINTNGYIDAIDSRIKHWKSDSTDQTMTTSRRTFEYNGDLCKSSVYNDKDCKITYKYNWSGYQLRKITERKEDLNDGSVEYNTFNYTFSNREIYPYTGTNLMAFVQSGMPQIYASMGYLGKGTPYILTEEIQGGYTKFDNTTSNNIKIRNTYSFDGDVNFKVAYNAFSNIYDTYSITFSK